MKIRRLIKESINFDTYDVIVLPCKISDDPYETLHFTPCSSGGPAFGILFL